MKRFRASVLGHGWSLFSGLFRPQDHTRCEDDHVDRSSARRGTTVLRPHLAAVLALLFGIVARGDTLPYLDAKLPINVRVSDFIARLTLDEKADLMRNESNGVPRLGLPRYDWWNEALHGVARAGEATVFPQAIGLAAMWDEPLMEKVGDTISTEARAKYHDAVRHGLHARYYGLTFWSPNINIFRDPRWGRGQETYGEDPFLTGKTGVAFVRGMQGPDTDHLKTAACAKHIAVHSGPEPARYTMNVNPDPADLHETYLPAFEMLVREGHVEAVMTAYSAIDGVPCTINPLLYGELRRWGFDGHVVSDCGAVYTVFEKFHLAHDFPEAEAMAVKAGLSLRCGSGDPQLGEAVRRGLLSEKELDERLAPLVRTLFRLGFFNRPEDDPYAKIPLAENDSDAHRAIALDAAERSMVLLKNDGVLPLRPTKLHRVAVIGPNADSVSVLLGNYHGTPHAPVTILAGLKAALAGQAEVDYVRGCDYAETKPGLTVVPRTALHCGDYRTGEDGGNTGLIAEYFSNPDLAGKSVRARQEQQIDAQWNGKAPVPEVNPAGFSVRWSGWLAPGTPGEHELSLEANGGVRVFLDGKCVIDDWIPGHKTRTVKRVFSDTVEMPLRIEYFGADATPAISFRWTTPPADAGFTAAIEKARQVDAVVFVGGIYGQLEGEDMRVDYDGFFGGDRTRIELPEIQQRLFTALAAVGKPIVFVNLSGSAMAFEKVNERANAILQAWYPGQAGGTAVANILLGKANPAGRLPVTFYRSTADLPAFEDYQMAKRTYRYFNGAPDYPFGHGLSYTRFQYTHARAHVQADGSVSVEVEIKNVGLCDGDDVVQIYLQEPTQSRPRAKESLAGFRRIHLAKGESKTVAISIDHSALRRWDSAKQDYFIARGTWRALVGASSADIRNSTEFSIGDGTMHAP